MTDTVAKNGGTRPSTDAQGLEQSRNGSDASTSPRFSRKHIIWLIVLLTLSILISVFLWVIHNWLGYWLAQADVGDFWWEEADWVIEHAPLWLTAKGLMRAGEYTHLERHPVKAVPYLRQALKDYSYCQPLYAIQTLGDKAEGLIPELVSYKIDRSVHGKTDLVSETAGWVAMGSEKMVRSLLPLLSSEDERIRERVLRSLLLKFEEEARNGFDQAGQEIIVEAIRKCLTDKNMFIRNAALELAYIGKDYHSSIKKELIHVLQNDRIYENRDLALSILRYSLDDDSICKTLAEFGTEVGDSFYWADNWTHPLPQPKASSYLLNALNDYDGSLQKLEKLPKVDRSQLNFPGDGFYIDVFTNNPHLFNLIWKSLDPLGYLRMEVSPETGIKMLLKTLKGNPAELRKAIDKALEKDIYTVNGDLIEIFIKEDQTEPFRTTLKELTPEWAKNELSAILSEITYRIDNPSPALLDIASSTENKLRIEAIETMGRIKCKEPSCVNYLIETLKTGTYEERRAAALSLYKLDVTAPEMLDPLLECILESKEPWFDFEFFEMVWTIDSKDSRIEEALKTCMREKKHDFYYINRDGERGYWISRKIAGQEEWFVESIPNRLNIIIGKDDLICLGEYRGRDRFFPVIWDHIDDSHWDWSAYATFYLGKMDLKKYDKKDDLLYLLGEDRTRYAAGYLLRQFSDPDVLKALEKTLEQVKYKVEKELILESIDIIKKNLND